MTNPTESAPRHRTGLWPPVLDLVARFGSARWYAPVINSAIRLEAGVRSRLEQNVAAWLHTYRVPTLDEMRRLNEEVAALRHEVHVLSMRKDSR